MQYDGLKNAPFAQKHDLGWVIVGDVCLGGVHLPRVANIYKTWFIGNGRPSYMQPFENVVEVNGNDNWLRKRNNGLAEQCTSVQ